MTHVPANVLVLVPARGGSKGIPRKNLAPIGGIPLLEFTLRAAIGINLPRTCVCLSSDDPEMMALGYRIPGIDVPFQRPASLAKDCTSMLPVALHALDWYAANDFVADWLIVLQPTNPFRTSKHINQAITRMIESGSESLISVNRVAEHPCDCIVQSRQGIRFVMERPVEAGRQHFPTVYCLNGAIYISSVAFLRRTRKFFDRHTELFPLEGYPALDIDTPEQLDYLRWLYETGRIPSLRRGEHHQ